MRRAIGFFEIKDKDLCGRIARLYTPNGVLETPTILPVVDPLRQELPISEIKSIGLNAIITNAYLMMRRLGKTEEVPDVHNLMNFDGIIMTDSGAYQHLRYGRVEVSQHDILEFQKRINSDIAVILDVPTGGMQDYDSARKAVEETYSRAIDALNYIDIDKRVWVLPIQGGPYLDLVEYSSKLSRKLLSSYQMVALGSPTPLLERYEYSRIIEMIFIVRRIIGYSKPLHLFGAGHPMIIPYLVAAGVDLFDSASYILYARDNRYMTRSRTYRLDDLDYFPCSCPICNKYDPSEVREMPKSERVRILAAHNLYVLKKTINEVKVAIREGRLWELLEEYSHAHPSLYTTFRTFLKYHDIVEKISYSTKGGEVHGVFIYGIESKYRPQILRHRRKVIVNLLKTLEHLPQAIKGVVLYPGDPLDKPFNRSRLSRLVSQTFNEEQYMLIAYTPILGVVPNELAECYPLSQFELAQPISSEVLQDLIHYLKTFVESVRQLGISIVFVSSPQIEWSVHVARSLHKFIDVVEIVDL